MKSNLIKKIGLESIISLILLISSIFLLKISYEYPETTAAFPALLLKLIMVLCVFVIIEAVMKRKKDNFIFTKIGKDKITKVIIMAILIILYGILIKPLGFILATTIFYLVVSKFMKSNNIIFNIVCIIIFDIMIYLIFVMFLKVPLPILPGFLM